MHVTWGSFDAVLLLLLARSLLLITDILQLAEHLRNADGEVLLLLVLQARTIQKSLLTGLRLGTDHDGSEVGSTAPGRVLSLS